MRSAFAIARGWIERLPMGDWTITITGTGSHHSTGNVRDADRMAVRFCQDLAAAGHRIKSATIHTGIRDNLLDSVPEVPYRPSPSIVAR